MTNRYVVIVPNDELGGRFADGPMTEGPLSAYDALQAIHGMDGRTGAWLAAYREDEDYDLDRDRILTGPYVPDTEGDWGEDDDWTQDLIACVGRRMEDWHDTDLVWLSAAGDAEVFNAAGHRIEAILVEPWDDPDPEDLAEGVPILFDREAIQIGPWVEATLWFDDVSDPADPGWCLREYGPDRTAQQQDTPLAGPEEIPESDTDAAIAMARGMTWAPITVKT
ncbi:MAG: hypothetical protein GF320_14185 [Armatimonadia bacterium]|nr:hypothetical protein [Armatimonadia bacterium]